MTRLSYCAVIMFLALVLVSSQKEETKADGPCDKLQSSVLRDMEYQRFDPAVIDMIRAGKTVGISGIAGRYNGYRKVDSSCLGSYDYRPLDLIVSDIQARIDGGVSWSYRYVTTITIVNDPDDLPRDSWKSHAVSYSSAMKGVKKLMSEEEKITGCNWYHYVSSAADGLVEAYEDLQRNLEDKVVFDSLMVVCYSVLRNRDSLTHYESLVIQDRLDELACSKKIQELKDIHTEYSEMWEDLSDKLHQRWDKERDEEEKRRLKEVLK